LVEPLVGAVFEDHDAISELVRADEFQTELVCIDLGEGSLP
jgi:hypothetical protein